MPGPWEIGRLHEQSASLENRQARGAFYTPQSVVEGLLRHAIPEGAVLPDAVLDPTCGGGAFLIGALDRMVACGLAPTEALGRVWAIDIDRGAVKATRQAIVAWAAMNGVPEDHECLAGLSNRVIVGDALQGCPKGFVSPTLVVGNPPFATPLKGTTFPESATAFRLARPELFGPYVDLAGIHLQSAVEICDVERQSKVAFVLPQSILASRDGAGMRAHLDEVAPMDVLWATSERVFDANVQVCAVILGVGISADIGTPGAGVICSGDSLQPVEEARSGESWASRAARALGAPGLELHGAPLGDRVSATAGFRDEYYALAKACRERSEMGARESGIVRICTVGSLDPLEDLWGVRPTRFAKKLWDQPVVDLERLEETPRITTWLEQQLRPKVLLPTQSKVFEPVIDREGCMAPVTPVLAVHADPADLDHIAAMFLSPPLVAWAYRRWFGSALSISAIKVAARDISSFPQPSSQALWDEAAAVVADVTRTTSGLSVEDHAERLVEIASLMNAAYEGTDQTLQWWAERLSS